METQKKRIQEFISYLGISVRAFERSIGVSSSTIRLAKDNLSANLIDKTCSTYPVLSRIWLLTGDGEMILRPEQKIGYVNMPNATNTNISSPGAIAGGGDMAEKMMELKGALAEKEGELAEMRLRVRELEIENARMQGMIEILKEK